MHRIEKAGANGRDRLRDASLLVFRLKVPFCTLGRLINNE